MAFKRVPGPVFAWIPGPGEVDPGWGVELPVGPDQGLPGGSPGHPSHPIVKPPGVPILPVDPDWSVPVAPPHPWLPGHWVPVDPGYGLPPVFGWRPVDPGFGVPEGGTPTPTPPIALPPGHWVPVDPSYGIPGHPCPPKPTQPIWIWIPEIGPGFGLKPAHPIAPGATPKK
jgi:hypothetical protein